jgi:hypothetical protein
MPKGYWEASGQFLKGLRKPNTSRQPIGEEAELPSSCPQKRGNFRSFPLNCYISIYIYKKSKTHLKILKNPSGSSPYYFLSHHTTFSQTQTGATVPLKTGLKS